MGMGEGRVEEEEVVEMEEEEEEAEATRGTAKWERFLPRMPVRVLLVEGDDSTRQIIAALLRKCSYKVAATSDGLKAWEALKGKPHNIDLVLTEVELPSISGFGLLTMIMGHEACKNIPVIMMSSEDSISMVFKCMLKGAADFLVKPIRKNELSNLWQHVWRRQISSGGQGSTHGQSESDVKHNLKADFEKSNDTSEHVTFMLDNKGCSEQGSDAQSSCTRSDMEAESAHMQNELELKQPESRDVFPMDQGIAQNNEQHVQLNSMSLVNKGEAGATSVNQDVVPEGHEDHYNVTNETYRKNWDQEKPSKEIIDLIGVIDDQPPCNHVRRDETAIPNGFSNDSEIHSAKCKSSSIPHLELSLKRCQDNSSYKQENDESSTWNHSDSSAFSLYNSKTVVPAPATPMNCRTKNKECNGTFSIPVPGQNSGNAGVALQPGGFAPHMHWETTSQGSAVPVQEGVAVRCTPFRVIPVPVPVGGVPFDSLCSGYGSVMQPVLYPQSAHPFWSPVPSMCQGASTLTNSSHQSDLKGLDRLQVDHQDDQTARSPSYDSTPNQKETMEPLNDQRHVSSETGDSVNASVCVGARSHVNISECESDCNKNVGYITATDIFKAPTQSGNNDGSLTHEEPKPTDYHRLSQREAALNKFRLKRKDRCYEKKVRYQSRKLLAEQRPRVKGQFVRQGPLSHQSFAADCHPYDQHLHNSVVG